ncbi:hypothetical protein EV193_113122 [Herbihabitans rhizosphaerae]|uniref:Ava_C0101 and related proteins n=1 Tax=Herbihabitans rhizosphaerae TaxID=1872711 RepID=A0A4Q7KHE3_9PSEU|nr:DUF5996 family protein [Herbihabitans rhizosphaerae]RZS32278.1 hypothetical protein EV193_113122 [Herbihabitans rhizosphaerae]
MELFPAIPFDQWRDTKTTVHLFCQVVGKIRLAASARRNHWWNVPFHVTGRGLTTRPMGLVDGNPIFTVDFDFVDHRLIASTVDGRSVSFPLAGHSVASFYRSVLEALAALGVTVNIADPSPFGLAEDHPPFPEDTRHAAYDPIWMTRAWQVLSQVNLVLEEFAAHFSGKASPVHLFWHSLDLAHTRFSDRRIDQPAADLVTREAYSREVISFGFWFGDATGGEAAFYSYTAPEPDGLAEQPLRPAVASWVPSGAGRMALLRYDDARAAPDPRATVLAFLDSAYHAGAGLAGWDVDDLACPGGVTTDPSLPADRLTPDKVGGTAV